MKHAAVLTLALAFALLSSPFAVAAPVPATPAAPAAALSAIVNPELPAQGAALACPAVASAPEAPLPLAKIGFICGHLECEPCLMANLRCVPQGGQCVCVK